MVVKALKLSPKNDISFIDCQNHWANEYIQTAASYNIIKGYDKNTFKPDELITREQIAVIIGRAMKISTITDVISFVDGDHISKWALEDVKAVVENSFMSGYPDKSFKPSGFTTRAEAATVLINILNKKE
jgi:hypothetical protein